MNHNQNSQFRILSKFLPILMFFALLCQGVYADTAGADTATDNYSYEPATAPIGPVFIDNTPSSYTWEGVDTEANYFDPAPVPLTINIIPVPGNFCPEDVYYVPGKFDNFFNEIRLPDYPDYDPGGLDYGFDKIAELVEPNGIPSVDNTYYGPNKFGDIFDNLTETVPTTPRHIYYDPYIYTDTNNDLGF